MIGSHGYERIREPSLPRKAVGFFQKSIHECHVFQGVRGSTRHVTGVSRPFPDYDPTKTLGSSPRPPWSSNGHARWRPLRAEVGIALWSAAMSKPVAAPRSSCLAYRPGMPRTITTPAKTLARFAEIRGYITFPWCHQSLLAEGTRSRCSLPHAMEG